ncbi:MAG: SGNH/GDSL hydrolase family protein [Blautia sp.]|nr:SGNH/GDSL hydrolase family protein [Blautia sp.]
MTPKKKILLSVILVLAAAVGCFFCYYRMRNGSIPLSDLRHFSRDSYDSVFLSMHSPAGYSPEEFSTYHGLNTLAASHEVRNMDELERYLDIAFSTDNLVNYVFLLLDPEIVWNSCGQDDSRWDAELQQGLFSFVSAHPGTIFEILLPYPSLAYWMDREPADLENTLAVYGSFVEDAYEYTNVLTSFAGFEDWLLSNPANYVSDFDVNEEITHYILRSCFCDNAYQVTPINGPILFGWLRELADRERTFPSVYPDLSDRCLVFFGDSVIANCEGSYSIPGCIAGLSGATAYNCAIGGSAASASSPDSNDFPNILDDFLADYCVEENGVYRFAPEGNDMSDKRLCFLLNFGLNDYFGGSPVKNPDDPYDITTYTGSLRSCLNEYMTLFPDADFIIMTPTYTNYFLSGTQRNSDVGGILTDYVIAARSLADELGIYCIDNYNDLGIDDSNLLDYSSDGCHPNGKGRILIARHIISFLGSL